MIFGTMKALSKANIAIRQEGRNSHQWWSADLKTVMASGLKKSAGKNACPIGDMFPSFSHIIGVPPGCKWQYRAGHDHDLWNEIGTATVNSRKWKGNQKSTRVYFRSKDAPFPVRVTFTFVRNLMICLISDNSGDSRGLILSCLLGSVLTHRPSS
jgi:hypothetical protein